MSDAPVILPPWVTARKQPKDADDDIYRLFFFLHKELNLSFDDLMQMPVPAILEMAEQLNKYGEEQEKEMKKAQRKR
jgi:hypothetical protein